MQLFSAWPRVWRREPYQEASRGVTVPTATPGIPARCEPPCSAFQRSAAISRAPDASGPLSKAQLTQAARAPGKPLAVRRLLFQNEASLARLCNLPFNVLQSFISEIKSKLILNAGR